MVNRRLILVVATIPGIPGFLFCLIQYFPEGCNTAVCYNPWREGEIMKGGKEFRIGIAVVALAITIAICMGGYHLYMEYGVKKPLTESLLQVNGVQNVEIQDEQEDWVITLTLVNDADLKTVFREANRLASLEMEDKKYCIEVADNPSPELSSLYNDLELDYIRGLPTAHLSGLRSGLMITRLHTTQNTGFRSTTRTCT